MLFLCDIDSTVANMTPEWLRRYNEEYNDHLTDQDLTSWNIDEFVKPECGKAIYKYLNHSDLYDNVNPYDGALAAIREFRRRGHRVVFVTTGVPGAWPKLRWLTHWGFLNDQFSDADFVCAYDKNLIAGNLLIDDRDRNVIEFAARGNRAILLDRPWNLAAKFQPTLSIKRANSWQKVVNLVSMMELGYD